MRWVAAVVLITALFSVYYFFGPNRETPRWQWALLREAMEKAGQAAIASFVMRGRECEYHLNPNIKIIYQS